MKNLNILSICSAGNFLMPVWNRAMMTMTLSKFMM